MSFTNLNYLDSLVVKLRIKSIFSFVGMLLFLTFLMFVNITIPEGAPLFAAAISAVLLLLMILITYYALENIQFFILLRIAQKTYKRAIEDPIGPTMDLVNEYMQLGLDRYGETLEFEKSHEIIILEKIQSIDKKCKEFKFNEDKSINGTIRANLNRAMDLLYDGFKMKSPFTRPKFLYYKKWKFSQGD